MVETQPFGAAAAVGANKLDVNTISEQKQTPTDGGREDMVVTVLAAACGSAVMAFAAVYFAFTSGKVQRAALEAKFLEWDSVV